MADINDDGPIIDGDQAQSPTEEEVATMVIIVASLPFVVDRYNTDQTHEAWVNSIKSTPNLAHMDISVVRKEIARVLHNTTRKQIWDMYSSYRDATMTKDTDKKNGGKRGGGGGDGDGIDGLRKGLEERAEQARDKIMTTASRIGTFFSRVFSFGGKDKKADESDDDDAGGSNDNKDSAANNFGRFYQEATKLSTADINDEETGAGMIKTSAFQVLATISPVVSQRIYELWESTARHLLYESFYKPIPIPTLANENVEQIYQAARVAPNFTFTQAGDEFTLLKLSPSCPTHVISKNVVVVPQLALDYFAMMAHELRLARWHVCRQAAHINISAGGGGEGGLGDSSGYNDADTNTVYNNYNDANEVSKTSGTRIHELYSLLSVDRALLPSEESHQRRLRFIERTDKKPFLIEGPLGAWVRDHAAIYALLAHLVYPSGQPMSLTDFGVVCFDCPEPIYRAEKYLAESMKKIGLAPQAPYDSTLPETTYMATLFPSLCARFIALISLLHPNADENIVERADKMNQKEELGFFSTPESQMIPLKLTPTLTLQGDVRITNGDVALERDAKGYLRCYSLRHYLVALKAGSGYI